MPVIVHFFMQSVAPLSHANTAQSALKIILTKHVEAWKRIYCGGFLGANLDQKIPLLFLMQIAVEMWNHCWQATIQRDILTV